MKAWVILFLVLGMWPTPFAGAARVDPADMMPVIEKGYSPRDDDERGIWQVSDKLEKEIAQSNLIERDEKLNTYVRGVVERLLGERATDLRLYIIRNPDFNASMFPNGMMIVHTGLLARMRNEAQLAAVLGHEAGHYLRQHSLEGWRNAKTKTAIMSIVALGGAAATGASGGTTNWYDLANAINSGLMLSIFSHSRRNEEEADAYGLRLLAQSQYDPGAAAEIWSQVIEERKASAKARKKRYNDRSRSAMSTHPPTEGRMLDLEASAKTLVAQLGPNASLDTGDERFEQNLVDVRASLLQEQIRLNDSGASLYLIESLAKPAWTSELQFFLGEIYTLRGQNEDSQRAADAYAKAVAFEQPYTAAFRAHGYAQMKLGNHEHGREALRKYLELRPDAPDAAMIKFSISQ